MRVMRQRRNGLGAHADMPNKGGSGCEELESLLLSAQRRSSVMRCVIATVVAAGMVGGGCGLDSNQEQTGQVAALETEAKAATDDCDRKFQPDNPSVAMARAKCLNEALEILVPALGYEDLVRRYMAARMAIAEQLQVGLITFAPAEEELARERTEVVAETKRRGR